MTIRRGGAPGVCSAGEITNVTQAFQPAGRFWLAKFPVTFEIEVPLCRGAQGDDQPELRANADHLRLETADAIAGAAVAAELFVNLRQTPPRSFGQRDSSADRVDRLDSAVVPVSGL